MPTVRIRIFNFPKRFNWKKISSFAQLQRDGDEVYLSVPWSSELKDILNDYGISHGEIPFSHYE